MSSSAAPAPLLLRNDHLELTFDPLTGAMTGFLVRATGWQVVNNPALCAGLRLLVPTPDHRCNTARPADQHLAAATFETAHRLVLRYASVFTHKAGELPISAALTIELDGEAARFTVSLDNRSPYVVEEVWAPAFAGLRQPIGEPPLQLKYLDMCGGLSLSTRFDSGFHTGTGYWGQEHPLAYEANSRVAFHLLDNDHQGLYLGGHEVTPRHHALWATELKPGYIDSLHLRHDIHAATLADQPAGFLLSRVVSPFLAPGEKTTLAPLTIQPYRGDWHTGIKLYQAWRRTWYRPAPRPAWADEIDAWLTLQMDTPEGDARYRYTDLPDIAAECLRHGVGAIHLIGYNQGGQDRNVPYIDPNPLLGTHDELKNAIHACEALGVRIILFFKIGWADINVPAFETEILPLTCRDMKGRPFCAGGWDYSTVANVNGWNRYQGVQLCHGSAATRALLLRELRKLLALGASGLQCDEVLQYHLCFDRAHEHGYGEPGNNGSLLAAAEAHAAATAHRPDFLLAGEGPTDAMSAYYRINYIRTADRYYWAGRHVPAWRYMDPGMRFAACIIGFDDRELINQCLTFGYILCYEPKNFKGRLRDFPATVAYGQRIQALRRRLRAYLWDGVFRHTEGAAVAFAEPGRPEMWSVFEEHSSGKRAVVIANEDATRPLTATVALAHAPAARFRVHTVDNLDGTALDAQAPVIIPARSVAVLVEV